MDKSQTAEIELVPETCSCGRGKLHKGITEDEIIAAFPAGKLLAKPLAAGKVELAMNA